MTFTLVETKYGKVQGEQLEKINVWRGIPYAKPPIGSLRFRAPEPPESWEGVKNATEFGPSAPQPSSEIMDFLGSKIEKSSEDCLYLNIWSPGADDKRRPVMVWIHGGAFISGSGSTISYDGASFAEQGDVVVVTINYRLGILGFLHLGEIGGKEYAASGNCGILDQVAALRWVQENISTFGGDPNRVTVFGESAGAMSIGVLLTLPSAKGLFHQAILESGAASNVINSSHATDIARKILNSLDVEHEELSKLEDLPIEKLIEASTQVPMMSFVPVVDGVYLPKHPEELLAEGTARNIPILIGTNKDEYRLFTFADPLWRNLDYEKLKNIFIKTFGPLYLKTSDQFVKNEKELSQALYEQLMTIHIFTYPALKLTESQINHGAPVWMYRFDWESPVLGGTLKACHALEIPFVWNNLSNLTAVNLTGDERERFAIADQMHQAWIAFAHNANPKTVLLPEWPEYDLDNRSTMIFNSKSRVEPDPDRDKRIKWERSLTQFH